MRKSEKKLRTLLQRVILPLILVLFGQPGVSHGEIQEEAQMSSPRRIRATATEIMVGKDEVVQSIHITGGKVVVEGVVQEDVKVVGGEAEIDGVVEGSVSLLGSSADINGKVGKGGVKVVASSVTIRGLVEGPVSVIFGELSLRDEGTILGDVSVSGGAIRGDQARIQGHIQFRSFPEWGEEKRIENIVKAAGLFLGGIFLILLLGLLLVAILIASLFRGVLIRGQTYVEKQHLGYTLLYGFLGFIAFLPLIFFFIITVIGIPVALLIIGIYLLGYLFGFVVFSEFFGHWLIQTLFKREIHFIVDLLLGFFILIVSLRIPVFNLFFLFFYLILSLGIFFQVLFSKVRKTPDTPQPPPVITSVGVPPAP